jgi:predicted Zn-ribbon and HTH transcriptional regulator
MPTAITNIRDQIADDLSHELGFYFENQKLVWSDPAKTISDRFLASHNAALVLWKKVIDTIERLAQREKLLLQEHHFTCAECGWRMTFNPSDPEKCPRCKEVRWVLGHDTGIFEQKQQVGYWRKLADELSLKISERNTTEDKMRQEFNEIIYTCEQDVVLKSKKLVARFLERK